MVSYDAVISATKEMARKFLRGSGWEVRRYQPIHDKFQQDRKNRSRS